MTTWEWIGFNAGCFASGVIGSALARMQAARQFRRRVVTPEAEVRRIILAEFSYWSDLDVDDAITLGATGAASNILAAVTGHPAPWHKPDWVRPSFQTSQQTEAV